MRSDFLPFVVEDQIVGYVHQGYDFLTSLRDVLILKHSMNAPGLLVRLGLVKRVLSVMGSSRRMQDDSKKD